MDELNRSCDRCGLKKRKCPGEKPSCYRCVKSHAVCTYSKRKPRKPSRQLTAVRARRSITRLLVQGHPKPTLSRLRASPATGLVGMQENIFLCDFFGSMGFMPLATQSDIRETIMKIILPSLQQSVVGHDCGEGDIPDALITEGGVRDTLRPADPSACTFWCAVAMGALAKGRPIESVATYVQLAGDAVASFSGPATYGMSQAWTILGYMHGLMGDQEKFYEHIALSEGFLSDCIEDGTSDTLPVGVAETIKMGDVLKLFLGDVGLAEMEESLLAEDVPSPQLGRFASEGELCRQLLQSAGAFEQSILTGMMCRGRKTVGYEDMGAVDSTVADTGPTMKETTTAHISGGMSPLRSTELLPKLLPSPMSPTALDRLTTIFQLRQLEEAAERPNIGDGIGGLAINNRLLYERTARGDGRGALDRVERCIEIYERYPGLHRCCMRAHKTHNMTVILVALANARAQKLYHRMRTAYNFAMPPGFLEIPPWEEWRGISTLCDNKTCRSIEAMLAGEDPTSGRSVQATLAGEGMASTSASQSLSHVVDGEQVEGPWGISSRQERGNLNAHSELDHVARRGPLAITGPFPEAGQTTPMMASDKSSAYVGTDTSPIDDDRGTICGNDSGTPGGIEQYSDLFVEEAGAPLRPLDHRRALSNESEDGRIVAGDWLEAVYAFNSSELD